MLSALNKILILKNKIGCAFFIYLLLHFSDSKFCSSLQIEKLFIARHMLIKLNEPINTISGMLHASIGLVKPCKLTPGSGK